LIIWHSANLPQSLSISENVSTLTYLGTNYPLESSLSISGFCDALNVMFWMVLRVHSLLTQSGAVLEEILEANCMLFKRTPESRLFWISPGAHVQMLHLHGWSTYFHRSWKCCLMAALSSQDSLVISLAE
jgi:hypothetical protein